MVFPTPVGVFPGYARLVPGCRRRIEAADSGPDATVSLAARRKLTAQIETRLRELSSDREFLSRGDPVPDALAAKMRGPVAGVLGRDAAAQLTGRGGAMDNAMRVMRTEINRAHGEAYMARGEDNPHFGGWRYLLSPQHPEPEPDICDLLSEQNLYGLGNGVYPTREKCPWPTHPNTLSFVVAVFKQQITAADRAGKETPLQALGRLSPEARRGVLGKAKAALFDEGRLTQGMIRAPWRAVQQRVARTRSRSDAWEWNENKNATNIADRRLDFRDARALFAGRVTTRLSPRAHADERRWQSIGQQNGETLVVVYTERAGRTRVISYRKASKAERALYDRPNQ